MEDIAVRSTFAPAFGRGHEYMDSLEGDGRGDSRFFGVAQRGFGKNFEKSCRKIWRGMRKVFIFAPAFAPKKGRGSRRSKNSSLRYWKVRKTSSNRGAAGQSRKRAAGRRDRKKTNEIHTMKSLILAQDER